MAGHAVSWVIWNIMEDKANGVALSQTESKRCP